MSCIRFLWRLKDLGGASATTQRANYWLCDTEAEQPATAYEGDLCYTKDSDKLWKRTASTWVEVGGSTGSVAWDDVTGKPSTFPPSAHNHDADIAAAVAAHEAASDPHTGYQRESEKGAANGYAGLDAGTKVPVAQIPTGSSASTVCIGNDARLSDSRAPNGSASGDLGGSYPSPTVAQARGLRETGGPTTLTLGAVADGEYLRRSGSTVVGGTPAGGGGGPTTAKKTADQTFNATGPADVTSLSFAVTSGHYYYFRFVCLVRSDTATVGVRLTVTVPGVTRFGGRAFHPIAADGAGCEFQGAITASGDAVIPTAVPAINTDYIAVVEGLLVPSANGTLQLRAGTETGTTVVTVRQGSVGFLWDLGT